VPAWTPQATCYLPCSAEGVVLFYLGVLGPRWLSCSEKRKEEEGRDLHLFSSCSQPGHPGHVALGGLCFPSALYLQEKEDDYYQYCSSC